MTTNRLSDSDMTQDSIASYDAALREMRTTDARMQSVGHAIATRAVISDPAGSPTCLYLYADGIEDPLAVIGLSPGDCVRVASDLLLSARRRYGRPLLEAGVSWAGTPIPLPSHQSGET